MHAGHRRSRVPDLPRRSATKSRRARASRCTRRVPDYHCSGAWNALGCAAIAARLLGTRRGHGPGRRSASPSTSGRAGRSCARATRRRWSRMARAGARTSASPRRCSRATASPARRRSPSSATTRRRFWSDLGTRWRIREQYFKAYPVCRWAQPAVEAALALQRAHGFAADDAIAGRRSKASAKRSPSVRSARSPRTTEEAQYSLPFPVAAALVFGDIGAAEVEPAGARRPARAAPAGRA